MAWVDALSLEELNRKGRAVVRCEGQQILLIAVADGLYACAQRCPHEGYPLSEGVVTQDPEGGGCILTCNWHNWKFDLETGATLVGGDVLRRFPIRVEAGRVLVEVAKPDPLRRRAEILAALPKALDDEDQQRLVRETARLAAIGADPVDAVRVAIGWIADRQELGMTHAFAGAVDWLALHDAAPPGSDEAIAALGEILGHIAEDGRKGPRFPFSSGSEPWSETGFLAAIEREDERSAMALMRGALAAGLTASDLAPVLHRAALAHYADFGHSLIYAVKVPALVRRLGADVAETLLLSLVRSLVMAPREDLLPEFRDYARHVAAWGTAPNPAPLAADALQRTSARTAMAIVAGWGAAHPSEDVFATLVETSAWILLHVDPAALTGLDVKLADNVGWLDFTHALTFAEAARDVVTVQPALWPAVLLQLACFIGRNSAYVDPAHETATHAVEDRDAFFAARTAVLLDHGRDRFIISVHLAKTLRAGEILARALPGQAPTIASALHRFLDAPMKGRHVLRTARQMRALVAEE